MPSRILPSSAQRWLVSVALLLLAATAVRSQETPPPTFSSDVKVVNVLATVRDKHGQIVNDLTKDDFKLAQDGHPQNIHYFAKDTNLPLILGLLVDTSLSERRMIDQERTASYGFLNDLMRPEKDKAFVIHFDWEIELLQDLTTSHQKLEVALGQSSLICRKFDLLATDASQAAARGSGGGGGHQRSGGGTKLYDAVFLASDELMRKQDGRKAIVLLTDGMDEGSKVSLDRAIETAQRSNTMVYSILYADPAFEHQGYGGGYPGGMGRHGGMGGGGMGRGPGGGGYPRQMEHPDGKKVLQRMSKETGGRFFEVSKKEPIDKIYTCRLKTSYATSTAWATRPTRPMRLRGITRSR